MNVNPGGMQWKSNLIGYNAISSYGSPSYYAQKMFSNYLGDAVITSAAKNIPTVTWQPPKRKNGDALPPKEVSTFFYVATRKTQTGTIYLKVVNTADIAQAVHIEMNGAKKIASEGLSVVLTSGNSKDTNTISEPTKIVPVTTKVSGLGDNFTLTFAPLSITILQIETK